MIRQPRLGKITCAVAPDALDLTVYHNLNRRSAFKMADNGETGGDAQVTFKVKTSSDSTHTITMAEAATVLDLKTKLATADYEDIPVERQRLIYSGRVMKNDDSLATYKIKPNNTIHMVKSAASNQAQSASTSNSTPAAVPTNMASGTANNPLAGLTGARYAGHQINLPGMDMFGPDGGVSYFAIEYYNETYLLTLNLDGTPHGRRAHAENDVRPQRPAVYERSVEQP